MLNNELIKNYNKSLEQKYNAVCFDIDGTLTEKNSKDIDKRIFPLLATLLKKHIPVVFITGRGETGLFHLKDEIVKNLKDNYEINDKHLLKLYALTNDGARIFITSNNSDDLFNICEYIASASDLKKLKDLNDKLINKLRNSDLLKYCKITYSEDKNTNTMLNIRLLMLTNDDLINKSIVNVVSDLIKESDSENINLTIGVYEGNQIFQIGTTIKSEAIKVSEKIIGIPQDSMLRIGDCGDELGNDYTMLNCPQGFSVDKTSGKNDSCFPVIDDYNNILTGVDATLLLLKKVRLLPTICLEHATEKNYTKAYSKIEKQLNLGKNKKIAQFNEFVNKKFELVEGIYGLYDKASGSVKIPLYEWIAIDDNNPLKQFWNKGTLFSLNYSMHDNESILLRGSRIYYYFLSNRYHDDITGKDVTTKQMIYDWLENNITFYKEAIFSLYKTDNINDLSNIKMVLGIVDNIRNYLIILLNQQLVYKNIDSNILINLNSLDKNSFLYSLYENLIITENFMNRISFDDEYTLDKQNFIDLIEKTISITQKFYLNFQNEKEKENYSKDFRAYREIDNFAENFITCYLTMTKDKLISEKGVCGLSYGGIELPIIMKSIDNNIEDVSIMKFNKYATGYSKKQSVDLRFFDIYKFGGIELIGIDENKEYILLDDNLLTGKTMQIALTSLYDINIEVNEIVIVRYPGVNRISQMFMPNHGAIDYHHFFNFIQGLYFSSPYTWKDPNSLNSYEDSLGIFDLNRRKILECLVKNGDYSQDSEVIYVKRKVKNEK